MTRLMPPISASCREDDAQSRALVVHVDRRAAEHQDLRDGRTSRGGRLILGGKAGLDGRHREDAEGNEQGMIHRTAPGIFRGACGAAE